MEAKFEEKRHNNPGPQTADIIVTFHVIVCPIEINKSL